MADHFAGITDEMYQSTAQLNQIDAILAVEVFQDAFNKFMLLNELAPKIEQHKDQITTYVQKEINNIIKNQGRLEQEFQEGIKKRDEAVSQNRTRDEINALNQHVQNLAQQI